MTVQTIESLRTDRMFDLFWEKVNQFTSANEVNEARLPRQRKRPRRYEEGTSTGDFHETPKQYYKQHYFEAIDLHSKKALHAQPGNCLEYSSGQSVS